MGGAGLLSLPPEVLGRVLQMLPLRSLVRASCACRGLRSAAAAVEVRAVLTTLNRPALERWLQQPGVAPRVRGVTVRCCLRQPPNLRSLAGLATLVLTTGMVALRDFERGGRLALGSLRHLDVHRVCGSRFADEQSSTACFAAMRRLHTLKLAFAPRRWVAQDAHVVFVEGLDSLRELRVLDIAAPGGMFVRCPLRVDSLRLRAGWMLAAETPAVARHLSLACTHNPFALGQWLTREGARALRTLHLHDDDARGPIPHLAEMTALETLHLRSDVVCVPCAALGTLPSLRAVRADARFCIATDGRRMPGRVAAEALVAGVPVSPSALRALFFT